MILRYVLSIVAFAFLMNLTFLDDDKILKDISDTIISIVNY